jgi:hypothetical protein
MNLITDQDERLLRWACERLDGNYSRAQCKWVAGLVDGGVSWVAVYSHFSSRNCQIALATDGGKRWASRTTFRAILRIPFVNWGLERVTFIVGAKNDASLRMMRKQGRFSIGAKEEGCMREMIDGTEDGIVFGLLKRECRWI